MLLRPGSLELPYWAKVQELRDAVMDFRESGKPVIAFLEFGGDREYYLASAADRVYLLPSSPLDLTGVASYEIFLRGALDKLGVQPDFLRIGEYKTAPSQLTEKEMSPAHREMTESINRDTYDRLVKGIAEARKLTEDDVRALMDRGPLLPSEAVAGKLVDGVAYEDELDDKVPELRDGDEAVDQIEVENYRASRGFASSAFSIGRPRVAVLYAVGTIVSGRGGFDATDGTLVGSDALVEEIRRIKDDSSIRAVVLRIDSPGGSSVASDVIWRELTLLRRDNPSRPLIVSMGDLAASGGYYIATPADEIVAQPSTLTGSIGIYVGKFALGQGAGEARRHDAGGDGGARTPTSIRRSPRSPASSACACRPSWTSSTRASWPRWPRRARRRPQEIDAMAQGRVWTGAQAHERGLVDRLGGLDVAIAAAKERAGIDADDDVEVVVYPHPPHRVRGVLGPVRRVRRDRRSERDPGTRPRESRGGRHRAGASLPPRRAARPDAIRVRAVSAHGSVSTSDDRHQRPTGDGQPASESFSACWALPAIAQRGPAPDPLIREGATVKLGPHTYAIPDFNVGMVPNVGIVVGNRATLVVDTGLGRRNGEADPA